VSEFASFPGADTPSETSRGFREGLPPAFRMRADAHYVEQLDGTTPAVTHTHHLVWFLVILAACPSGEALARPQ